VGRCSFFTRFILVSVVAFAGGVGCQLYERNVPSASTAPVLPGQSTGVFTTARPSFGAALNNFMDRRPTPVQPIEFPHNIHVGKQIACTEYCHEAVTSGPVAGLPSVKTCMICHNAIATDRPRIKQITAMREKGIDLAWQRVFNTRRRRTSSSIMRRTSARKSNARPVTATSDNRPSRNETSI